MANLTGCKRETPGPDISLWLEMCRSKLMLAMADSQREKVPESQGMQKRDVDRCSITDRNDATTSEFWSDGGRFSLNRCKVDRSSFPRRFRLEVFECTQDQWMENALRGTETEPEPFLPKLGKIPKLKFGLRFSKPDGKGGKENWWKEDMVRVALVDTTSKDKNGVTQPTLAAEFPEICAGSRLFAIVSDLLAPLCAPCSRVSRPRSTCCQQGDPSVLCCSSFCAPTDTAHIYL